MEYFSFIYKYLEYNKNKKIVEDRVITVANAVDAVSNFSTIK